MAPLERALELADRPDAQPTPTSVAEARILLARALLATGGDRARALGLAEQALDEFSRLGEHGAGPARETAAWLAANSGLDRRR